MKIKFSSSLSFILSFAFIFTWWFCAFKNSNRPNLTLENLSPPPLSLTLEKIFSEISLLDRNQIQQALGGNPTLMRSLIQQWDIDSTILSSLGVKGIQRLSQEDHLQALFIEQILNHYPKSIKDQLNRSLRVDSLVDACHKKITAHNSFHRFLPQSYISASYLLAIAPSEEIMGIPKGLRYFSHLYCPNKLNSIPQNTHQLIGEKLYRNKPDLVFTAPYSHPPFLEALKRQKITTYTLHHENTLEHIKQSLLQIGHLSNHILEAQLLAHFIDACFLTIDNRLLALKHFHPHPTNTSVLCLVFHQAFELPTSKSLIGQLMKRALSFYSHLQCEIPSQDHGWSVPINAEKIYLSNPDALFISAPFFSKEKQNSFHLLLKKLDAYKNKKVFYLDSSLQNSANQYIALAYFDLFQAIARTITL